MLTQCQQHAHAVAGALSACPRMRARLQAAHRGACSSDAHNRSISQLGRVLCRVGLGYRRAARRAGGFAHAAAADGAPDAPQAGYAAAEAAVAKENELADLAAGKDARLPALEEDALEKEEIAEEKARGRVRV